MRITTPCIPHVIELRKLRRKLYADVALSRTTRARCAAHCTGEPKKIDATGFMPYRDLHRRALWLPEISRHMNTLRLETIYDDLDRRIRALDTEKPELEASRRRVETALTDGNTYYGINTGFGALATKRVGEADLSRLQTNLLLSHAVGVGEPLRRDISRLMLQLKVHALALGYSGISVRTFDRLLEFTKRDLIPIIPSRGSLGASGDLAPLAHMSLPLIGYGSFWDSDGRDHEPASTVLERHGLEPIELQPKDGLALINGTQLMAACGAWVLERSIQLLKTADLIAAMSLEGLQGSIKPFDERIHRLRPHAGQLEVSKNVRSLLVESEILENHRNCGKVQDPYCLRCVPQVHGASRDALRYCNSTVETEINSVTDNPLVFDNGDIVSGGNFHGQPLALALDHAAIALSELGSISERRIYLLLEGHDGLPTLLMQETGINSGFMIPQYTAASLVSENKVLSHPASVDSIPSSLGQEDHVSMGSISALKLLQIYEHVETILAIELLSAAQALDFRKPLKPGCGVHVAHEYFRSQVPHLEEDRFMRDEIDASLALLRDKRLIAEVESACGTLL